MKYDSLFLTQDQLKKNIHLQVIAKFRPLKIKVPAEFIPRNQIDKIIFKILKGGCK